MCNEYNGHANYATWNVSLWLDNERDTQRVVDGLIRYSRSLSDFQDALKDWVMQSAPLQDGASMFKDIFDWGMAQVDWYQIAKGYWDEYHTDDEQEEGDEQ